MRLRTALLIGFGSLIALLLAGVVVLSTMDFGRYKGLIVAQLEQATGRKLTIAGDLKLALFPVPTLNVQDVRFANPDWGSRPDMATFSTLAARIDVLPLIFGGNLRIVSLTLKDADLLLETDPKGRTNWAFGPGAPVQPNAGMDLPSLGHIQLQNVRITYRDGQTGRSMTATLTELVTVPSEGESFTAQAVIDIAGARVTLKGSAREPLVGRGLDIAVTVEGKDLAALAGTALPAKPYHLTATLSGDADTAITLKALQASFGASSVTGEASLTLAVPRPSLVATLTAPLIDLTELPTAQPPAQPAGEDRVFSAAPLPLALLHPADADLTVSIAALKAEHLTLQNLTAHATLNDSDLRIQPFAATLLGSTIGGVITLSAHQVPATLDLKLDAKQVDVGRLLAQASGNDLLDAKGDIAVAVRGAGPSVRAIMATLDGKSSLVVGRGVIKSRYADLLGADVFREAFAWTQGKIDARLNCLVARFDIQNGRAVSRGLLMDTTEVSMLGEGTINLGTERLDLELTPRPKDASLLNLAAPIDIGGTLRHPTIRPNKAALAKQAAIGIAGFVNPLIVIGKLVLDNTATADNNPCVAALDGSKSAPAKPAGGVSGAVKDLGHSIESLFK
jgi:uncharacterized protein involved in outer membrane biogenesis